MNRAARKLVTTAPAAVALVIGLGFAAPAGAAGSGSGTTRGVLGVAKTGAACKGAQVKPTIHAAAVKRETTLTALVAKLGLRTDPFALNGPQVSALQSASSAITALDAQIAATCYPTIAALRADASKLFVGYRVYWLRGPQTHVIEAADLLANARAHLGAAATKLGPLAGQNAAAQTDLAAMNAALAAADAKLGDAPQAGASITAVAGLQPAADMTSDTAALRTARTQLVAIRASLGAARTAALKVVADLKH